MSKKDVKTIDIKDIVKVKFEFGGHGISHDSIYYAYTQQTVELFKVHVILGDWLSFNFPEDVDGVDDIEKRQVDTYVMGEFSPMYREYGHFVNDLKNALDKATREVMTKYEALGDDENKEEEINKQHSEVL